MVLTEKQIIKYRKENPHISIDDLAEVIQINNGRSDLIVNKESLRKLLGE